MSMQKSLFGLGLLMLMLTNIAQGAITRPVNEEGKPTRVYVGGAILDVDKINSSEQNFTLNLYIIFRWKDPRLAHHEQGSVIRKLSEIWNPRLAIVNTQKHWKNTKDEVEITSDGTVTYRLHVFGDFSQPMDLYDYPQDHHVFRVPVVAVGYRPDEVVLLPNPELKSFIAEKLSVADWHISNIQGVSQVVPFANGIKRPGFVFSFEGRRLLHHYIVKVILPLVLIVMMSWVVFWIDPKNLPNKLGVTVTTVLTLIAYHIALSGRLPEIPHFTNMDKFLFGSTVLVFMSLIEVVMTSHYSGTDQIVFARKIDRIARWVFPVLFIIVIGVSFSFI
jgi:hypothetical protein